MRITLRRLSLSGHALTISLAFGNQRAADATDPRLAANGFLGSFSSIMAVLYTNAAMITAACFMSSA
jgi:hypothetical protein